MTDVVEFKAVGRIGWVFLNRPEKLNAINDELIAALTNAITELDNNSEVGSLVLAGRGRAFSSGGDLADFAVGDERGFEATVRRLMDLAGLFRACTKPIIAAVHGYALAGGFELAVNCDIRIASSDAVFGLPDTPLGLSPTSGMTYQLPRIIGLGRALHLTLLGENISAIEAQKIGLVTKVVAPEALLKEAGDIAEKIASFPKIGVKLTKQTYYAVLDSDFESARKMELKAEIACFATPEVREQLNRFLRRPRSKRRLEDADKM